MLSRLNLCLLQSAVYSSLLFFSAQALADCGDLHVHLATDSGVVCKLVSYHIDNDYYVHMIKGEVPKKLEGKMPYLVIRQAVEPMTGALYGANITIRYKCSNKKDITISSHQNYCYAKAGHITAHANAPASIVSYKIDKGGWYSKPGAVYWEFH